MFVCVCICVCSVRYSVFVLACMRTWICVCVCERQRDCAQRKHVMRVGQNKHAFIHIYTRECLRANEGSWHRVSLQTYERVHVCMCTRLCVRVCVCARVDQTHTHTYTHTFTYTYTFTCVHIFIYIKNTFIDRFHIYERIYICVQTYIYMYVCIYIYTYVCTNIYIYVYTHTKIHKHAIYIHKEPHECVCMWICAISVVRQRL